MAHTAADKLTATPPVPATARPHGNGPWGQGGLGRTEKGIAGCGRKASAGVEGEVGKGGRAHRANGCVTGRAGGQRPAVVQVGYRFWPSAGRAGVGGGGGGRGSRGEDEVGDRRRRRDMLETRRGLWTRRGA